MFGKKGRHFLKRRIFSSLTYDIPFRYIIPWQLSQNGQKHNNNIFCHAFCNNVGNKIDKTLIIISNNN